MSVIPPGLPDQSMLIVRADERETLTRAAEAIHALYRDADVQMGGDGGDGGGGVLRACVGGMHADLLWSLIQPALRGHAIERVDDDGGSAPVGGMQTAPA